MTLTPAYGRDYRNPDQVLTDWNENKDFIESLSGKPMNKADADRYDPGATIKIRYNKLTQVLILGR